MDNRNPQFDEPLDRAIDALRREPDLGPFPSDRILRNLGASRDDAGQRLSISKRKHDMRFLMKIAAAIALAASLAAILFTSFYSRSIAYAQVAEKIRGAKTMTAEIVSEQPGVPAIHMKVYSKEPGFIRFENGDVVSIADAGKGDVVVLNSKEKTALHMHIDTPAGADTQQMPNWLETLKKSIDQ